MATEKETETLSAFQEYEKAAAEASMSDTNVKGSAKFEVDLTKPLVFQVGHLGDRYDNWVHTPIVSKTGPRLFKSDLMEFFTNTKWWMIPLIWLPVVVFAEYKAIKLGVPVSPISIRFKIYLDNFSIWI